MPEMPNKEEMTSPYPTSTHTELIKHVFTTSKEPCSRKLKIRKMCIICNCYLRRKLDYDIYALVYLLLYLIFSLFSVFLDVGLFSDSRDAEQRRDGSLFSDSRGAEQRRDDLSLSSHGTYRVNKARGHHEQRALPTNAEG